ncbi:MAG: DUF2157 domain-containing protein [Dehalococcoidia bacterium]|jgi:uncharacterized membrane protein|nr:DUF2157 domain-containing protein [Dehalococcoidia bacterium]
MTAQTPNNESDRVAERPEVDVVVEAGARPDPRHSWLKGRVGRWRESGLISDEQSEAILNFESVPEIPFRLGIRFSRLIVVLSTLGAVLIGAGIISFVAAGWSDIPAIAKLVLLVGGQSLTYWAAYQLQYVRGYPRVGGAVMFTGAAWFGANVFLVAQSYHLATDNPDLLIWWFLGVLPLAYLTRSKAITVMAVGIFTVGISWKAASQADGADIGILVMATLLFAAAAMYAIGMVHLRRESLKFYAGPYLVCGALLAIGVTYLFTFDVIFTDISRRYDPGDWVLSGGYFVLSSVVSAGTLIALVFAVRNSDQVGRPFVERLAEPAVVVLVVATGWFVATRAFETPGPYVVVANLVLILLVLGMIVLGIVNRREALVNVGIVFFVIDLSTRYIELTLDMLDTSLTFIVGGLFLLGIGYAMERGRRRLLRQFGMMEVNLDTQG